MKRTILTSLFLCLLTCAQAQDYITSDIFARVFNIRYDSMSGTCFLIRHKNKNYFVTAKHIFKDTTLRNKTVFPEILQDSLWKVIESKLLFHNNVKIDIALLEWGSKQDFGDGLDISPITVAFGDHGFFLGYPFGFKTVDKGNVNDGFPIALIKSAVFSGATTENGIFIKLLDGMNNPGFSGGPVIFKNRFDSNSKKWYVVGVVSAYVNQNNQLVSPLGTINYSENSGIVIAIDSKHIMEILDSR